MKRVNTESLISICHAFRPFLETFSSLYCVTLTFFLATLTFYALCYGSDSFWWAVTLNGICFKKKTIKFISEIFATTKILFDESTQSSTRIFHNYTKTVKCRLQKEVSYLLTFLRLLPQSSRLSSLDIGFKCMKLQKPPRVHSLQNKEKIKWLILKKNCENIILQFMFQSNPRNNRGQSHTKDGEIEFNHQLENTFI